jgi:hypothetical protein
MTARTESLLEPRPSPLVPFVALSIGVHVLAAVLLSVASWLFAPAKVSLDQQPVKASLVRLGKKRDEKLLPRKEEPPPKTAPRTRRRASSMPSTRPRARARPRTSKAPKMATRTATRRSRKVSGTTASSRRP